MDKPLTIEEFIFELPLYNVLKADGETVEQMLMKPLRFSGKIDGYNPVLRQETTYQVINESRGYSYGQTNISNYIGYNTIVASCVRTGYTITTIAFLSSINVEEDGDIVDTEYELQKIGQYPSIADLHISKIKAYDKVLSKNKLKEFTRAIGLAAAGVGIGSFIYLRRVFEHLLSEAYNKAKKDDGWDDEQFKKNRMADKIEQLNHHLPEFLVENREIYGILSKGVHDLEENECLAYFEPLKIGIEIILDAKIEEFEKQKKIEEAKKKIQAINQTLKKA